MEYRSVADLNRLTQQWATSLPRDFDLIAGIPRSGMLVANLLALHLHLPLTDVEGLVEGRIMASGRRHTSRADLNRRRKILVVDDSIHSGESLARCQERLDAAATGHDIHYGALIASPEAVRDGKIRQFAEVVPMPRIFEWNIMHAPSISRTCVGLEGVLAPADEMDVPRVRPSYPIGWIITSRPESRRSETERWLRERGIQWRELLMGCTDWARQYQQLPAELLVVHGADQASELAERADRPVFATEMSSMFYPGEYPRYVYIPLAPPHPLTRWARFVASLPIRVLNKIAKLTMGHVLIPIAHEDTRHRRYAVPHWWLSK